MISDQGNVFAASGNKKGAERFQKSRLASLADTKSMLPAADVDGLKGCNGPTFPVSVGLGNFLRPSASSSARRNDGGEKEREEVTKLLRGLLHRTDGRGRTTLSHTVWRRMRPRRALLNMKGEGSKRVREANGRSYSLSHRAAEQ